MKRYGDNCVADEGNEFVLTSAGYRKTPDHIKPEREKYKPLKGFETRVPFLWLKNNWVMECPKDS